MTSHGSASRGISLIILATFFFTLMGALARLVSEGVPSMQLVFFRGAVNALIILPFILRRKVSIVGRRPFFLLFRSIVGFGSISLYFYALPHLKFAELTVLQQTSSIFTALLSLFLPTERASRGLIGLIAAAFCGVVMIVKPGVGFDAYYATCALLGALFTAMAFLSIRRLHDSEDTLTIIFSFTSLCAFASFLIWGHTFVELSHYTFFMLVLSGISGSIGQILMTNSFRMAPAPVLAPFTYSAVIFALMSGVFFWGEWLDMWSFLGSALIVTCGIGIHMLNRRVRVQVI